MRSSDFLHRLIKSLSKGDRRNFKVYARLQDGDKKYVQLFDAIGKQDVYDEKKLLKQFKGERFTKQFSVAKNYLYNYILKTLHVFQKDPHAELTTLIHQVEILIGKNLFDQAQKLLRKAKHMAERHERFGELLELLYHERKILQFTKQDKLYNAFVSDIQSQESKALLQLQNLQEYLHLYDDIYQLTKRAGTARGVEEKRKVERILTSPLIVANENGLSERAKLKRYEIVMDCHVLLHNFAEATSAVEETIELYEGNDFLRKEENLKYIYAISNYGIYNYSLGRKDIAKSVLSKLKSVEVFSEEESIRVFEKYFTFKIGFFLDSKNLEMGLEVAEEIELEFPKMRGKLMKSKELFLEYMMAYFYIFANQAENALPWINLLLNEPKTEFRIDLQCMARILNLIIHYELGNYEHMEYAVKAAVRFVSNRDRLFGFEKTILKYLRILSNLHPDQKPSDVLVEFRNQMEIVLKDSFEKKALRSFDILEWIDAKILNVGMHSLSREVQEKKNRQQI